MNLCQTLGSLDPGCDWGWSRRPVFHAEQFRVWGGWIAKSFMRIKDSIALIRKRESRFEESALVTATSLSLSKEVVGTHALLTRSLFGGDILRRFLRRVSLAKPTSAPLRF